MINRLKFILSLVTLVFCSQYSHAQELFCSVQVQAPTLSGDREVFQDMQKTLTEYINTRIWTKHNYENHERIRANIVIIIDEKNGNDYFQGTLQLKMSRPVFNSTYETLIANINDKDFACRYVPFQTLEFSENTYIDNLTSIMNYYAYIILGMDYSTFSLKGGEEFFKKAQDILNLASNSNENGWESRDGKRSRYWLVQNLSNSRYSKFHSAMYTYHRQGLDLMEKNLDKGRQNVLLALKEMEKLNLQNPGIYITRIWNDAKKTELVQIFGEAFPNEKQEFVRIMERLDPANINKYREVMANNK